MGENVLFRFLFISFERRIKDGLEIERRGRCRRCLRHGGNGSEERRLRAILVGLWIRSAWSETVRLRPHCLSLSLVDRPRLLREEFFG